MHREIEINNYIARGIIEANLNFAKENKSSFCLVKFSHKVDLEDAYTFKDLISFIHTYTNFSPILQQENDTFLLFLKDVKIHQAKAIINKLESKINNIFNFEIKNIGITVNHPSDTYKKLIERVDKYFVMSKLSSKKKIFYGTVDFDFYDTIDSMQVLKDIFNKSSNIVLNNIYKGIPIIEKVRVSGFSDGIMQIRLKSEKIPFYENETFTFIQHDMIPDIIKADILKIDKNRFVAVLGNLRFLPSSPVERSNVRIQPTKNIHAILAYGHKKVVEGQITSISENSLSLQTSVPQVSDILDNAIFHKELTIKFQLANDRNFLTPIKIKTYIFNVTDNNIILNISPSNIEKTRIRNYISSRQDELLLTLKKELEQ